MNQSFPKRSFVGALPCIDARELRRLGLFGGADAQCAMAMDGGAPGGLDDADLRFAWSASARQVRVTAPSVSGGPWTLDVVHETRVISGRYYFICPESGERCEKLYYSEGGWAGRKARRLVYPSQYSQAAGLYTRRLRVLGRERLELEQAAARTQQRAASIDARLQRLCRRADGALRADPDLAERLPDEPDFSDLVALFDEPEPTSDRLGPALHEAALSTEMALERARALSLDTDDSLEWLFRRCDRFKAAVPTTRRRLPVELRSAPRRPAGKFPRISLRSLTALHPLKDGARHGVRLDWSGLGAGLHRCDMVLDLRDPEFSFAGLELIDAHGLVEQSLRLERTTRGLNFVCPFLGVPTETIAYREGWFAAPSALRLSRG